MEIKKIDIYYNDHKSYHNDLESYLKDKKEKICKNEYKEIIKSNSCFRVIFDKKNFYYSNFNKVLDNFFKELNENEKKDIENKIDIIIKNTDCNFCILFNDHLTNNETVFQYLKDLFYDKDEEYINQEIEKNIYNDMIKKNKMIEFFWYKDTPIGCYQIYNSSLNKILDEILDFINTK